MSYRHIPVRRGGDMPEQININLTDIERAFAAGTLQLKPITAEPRKQEGVVYWFSSVPTYTDGLYICIGGVWVAIGSGAASASIPAVGALRDTTTPQPVRHFTAGGVWGELTASTRTLHNATNSRIDPGFAWRLQVWKDGTLGATPFYGNVIITGSWYYEPGWAGSSIQIAIGKNGTVDTTTAITLLDSDADYDRTLPFTIVLPQGAIEGDSYSIFCKPPGAFIDFYDLDIHINLRT